MDALFYVERVHPGGTGSPASIGITPPPLNGGTMDKKIVSITIRLTENEKALAHRIAEIRDRSVGSIVRRMIRAEAKHKGLLCTTLNDKRTA